MKSSKYKYILVFITITILATIVLQVFWNIKNFKENRIQLIKEVQTAFDNSIEYYYVEDSKNDFMAFVDENGAIPQDDFIEVVELDSAFTNNISRMKASRSSKNKKTKKDSSVSLDTTGFAMSVSFTAPAEEINEFDIPQKLKDTIQWENNWKKLEDSLRKPESNIEIHGDASKISRIKVIKGKRATDSISKLQNLVNKIIISTYKDTLDYTELSQSVDRELARKNITVDYSLQHFKADTVFNKFEKKPIDSLPLNAFSGTTFLPPNQKLQIAFSDPTVLILKRSLTEILLSLALSLSIIFCLLYLLKTINKQKKIDEIKNDLISNITHEFKTPITTISSAIEGIKHFNDVDDKEKTTRYLNISGQQLMKLEIMVEKLLETASLDTDQLVLKKEQINLTDLLHSTVEKYQMVTPKTIIFEKSLGSIYCKIDVFHFENALSNLIDNAIKYGGEMITINLSKEKKHISIAVNDNGTSIDKNQREKIFDKFYRIPKGNIHDVKGFGIGLFYAKKIIEKHGGTLALVPNTKTTIFKISFPDV